jgi:hypothetical protein
MGVVALLALRNSTLTRKNKPELAAPRLQACALNRAFAHSHAKFRATWHEPRIAELRARAQLVRHCAGRACSINGIVQLCNASRLCKFANCAKALIHLMTHDSRLTIWLVLLPTERVATPLLADPLASHLPAAAAFSFVHRTLSRSRSGHQPQV